MKLAAKENRNVTDGIRPHATVVRDGYIVPLIGIPDEAALEECDCCHNIIGLSQAHYVGPQVLCERCLK